MDQYFQAHGQQTLREMEDINEDVKVTIARRREQYSGEIGSYLMKNERIMDNAAEETVKVFAKLEVLEGTGLFNS